MMISEWLTFFGPPCTFIGEKVKISTNTTSRNSVVGICCIKFIAGWQVHDVVIALSLNYH